MVYITGSSSPFFSKWLHVPERLMGDVVHKWCERTLPPVTLNSIPFHSNLYSIEHTSSLFFPYNVNSLDETQFFFHHGSCKDWMALQKRSQTPVAEVLQGKRTQTHPKTKPSLCFYYSPFWTSTLLPWGHRPVQMHSSWRCVERFM